MMPPRLPHSSGGAAAAAAATKRVTTSRRISHSTSSHFNSNNSSRNSSSKTFHKRRRRRHSTSNASTDATSDDAIAAAAAAAGAAAARCSNTWRAPVTYLALLLLSTTCSLGTAAASSAAATSASASTSVSGSALSIASSSPCAPQHWWDPLRNKCTACTVCQGEMIPLRPCQLHTNTICGSIYDLKIDWVVLAKTEPNWKERRKSSEYEHFDQDAPLQHLTHEQLQRAQEAAAAWALDWQTGVLYVAVLTCLIFFSVAACILIHHMRQWRRMERRLDQDVEELSTKLMAKLAEVQSLDGGTFFIGNADALRGLPAAATHATLATATQSGIFQPQHVLLPEKHQGKHQERRILKTLQPGNVYIEENNGGGLMGGVGASCKG